MKLVANFAICVILCCSKLVASVPFPEDLARYLAATYGTSALTGLQQQLQPQQIPFNSNQDHLNNVQNQLKTSQSYPLLQNGDVSTQRHNAGSVQKTFKGQSQVPIFQQQRLSQQPLNIPFQQQNYQQVNEPFISGLSDIINTYDGSASQTNTQPDNIIRTFQQQPPNPGLNTQQNIDEKVLLHNDQTIHRQEPLIQDPSLRQTIEQPSNIQTLNVREALQDSRIQSAISGTKFKKRFLVIHPDGTIDHVDSLESVIKQNPNYVLLNSARITEPTRTEEHHPPTVQENIIKPHVQSVPQIQQNNQQFRVTEVTAKKDDLLKRQKVENNKNEPDHNKNKTVPSIKTVLLNNNVQKVQNKLNNTKFVNNSYKTKNTTQPLEQSNVNKTCPTNNIKTTSTATSDITNSSKIPKQVISKPKNITNEKAKTIPKHTEAPVPTEKITPSKHVEVNKRKPHTNKVETTINITSNSSEPQSTKKKPKEKHTTKLNNSVNKGSKASEPKSETPVEVKPNITSEDTSKVNKSLNIVPISISKSNNSSKAPTKQIKTTTNKNNKTTTNLPNYNNSKNNSTDKFHVRKELVNKSEPKAIVNNSSNTTPIKEDKRISDHKQNNNKKNVVKEKEDYKNPSTKSNEDIENTQLVAKSDDKDPNEEGKQKMLDIIKTLSHSEYKDKVVVLQIVMPPIVDREVHTTVYPNGTIIDEVTELIWDSEDEDADPVEVKTFNVRNINDEE